MEATAKRDGEDYVLNGRKVYIGNSHVGDLHGVVVRTGTGSKGLSAFLDVWRNISPCPAAHPMAGCGTPGTGRRQRMPVPQPLGWFLAVISGQWPGSHLRISSVG
jgi:hypothetical protein